MRLENGVKGAKPGVGAQDKLAHLHTILQEQRSRRTRPTSSRRSHGAFSSEQRPDGVEPAEKLYEIRQFRDKVLSMKSEVDSIRSSEVSEGAKGVARDYDLAGDAYDHDRDRDHDGSSTPPSSIDQEFLDPSVRTDAVPEGEAEVAKVKAALARVRAENKQREIDTLNAAGDPDASLHMMSEENIALKEELRLQREMISILEMLRAGAEQAKLALAVECKQLHKEAHEMQDLLQKMDKAMETLRTQHYNQTPRQHADSTGLQPAQTAEVDRKRVEGGLDQRAGLGGGGMAYERQQSDLSSMSGELNGVDPYLALEKALERQEELELGKVMLEEENRVLVSSCEQLRASLDAMMRSSRATGPVSVPQTIPGQQAVRAEGLSHAGLPVGAPWADHLEMNAVGPDVRSSIAPSSVSSWGDATQSMGWGVPSHVSSASVRSLAGIGAPHAHPASAVEALGVVDEAGEEGMVDPDMVLEERRRRRWLERRRAAALESASGAQTPTTMVTPRGGRSGMDSGDMEEILLTKELLEEQLRSEKELTRRMQQTLIQVSADVTHNAWENEIVEQERLLQTVNVLNEQVSAIQRAGEEKDLETQSLRDVLGSAERQLAEARWSQQQLASHNQFLQQQLQSVLADPSGRTLQSHLSSSAGVLWNPLQTRQSHHEATDGAELGLGSLTAALDKLAGNGAAKVDGGRVVSAGEDEWMQALQAAAKHAKVQKDERSRGLRSQQAQMEARRAQELDDLRAAYEKLLKQNQGLVDRLTASTLGDGTHTDAVERTPSDSTAFEVDTNADHDRQRDAHSEMREVMQQLRVLRDQLAQSEADVRLLNVVRTQKDQLAAENVMLKMTCDRLTQELKEKELQSALSPTGILAPPEADAFDPNKDRDSDPLQDTERVELVRQVWRLKDQLSARLSVPTSAAPSRPMSLDAPPPPRSPSMLARVRLFDPESSFEPQGYDPGLQRPTIGAVIAAGASEEARQESEQLRQQLQHLSLKLQVASQTSRSAQDAAIRAEEDRKRVLEDAKARNESAVARISELESDLELQMGVSMSMKRELVECRNQLLAAQNKGRRLEKALQAAEEQRGRLKEELEAMEREMEKLRIRQQHDTLHMRYMDEGGEDLQYSLSLEAPSRVAGPEQRLREVQKEKEELQDSYLACKEECVRLASEVDRLQAHSSDSLAVNEAFDQIHHTLTQRLQRLSAEQQQLHQQRDDMRGQLQTAETQVKASRSRVRDLEKRVQEERKLAEEARKGVGVLEAKLLLKDAQLMEARIQVERGRWAEE